MAEGVDSNTEECLKYMRGRIESGVYFSVDAPEGEKQLIPVCCNAKEFLDILRNTSEFGRTVEKRFQNASKKLELIKGLFPEEIELSKEEVVKAYEQEESFKQLFWNFSEKALHLAYDPSHYSAEFNHLFGEYRVVARFSVEAAQKGDRDEIIEKDRVRSIGHNKAARQLVEDGLTETEYIARILVRAFLVDVGEDYIASARLSDQIRVLRALDSREAKVSYLARVQETGGVEEFSPESIFSIQQEFLQRHPQTAYANRLNYLSARSVNYQHQGDQENFSLNHSK